MKKAIMEKMDATFGAARERYHFLMDDPKGQAELEQFPRWRSKSTKK